jgi:hypothetical protein
LLQFTLGSFIFPSNTYLRKFQGKIEEELAKAGEQEHEQDLEGLWELWKNTLLKAAKQVCGTFRPGGTKKATHWWTPEIGKQVKLSL